MLCEMNASFLWKEPVNFSLREVLIQSVSCQIHSNSFSGTLIHLEKKKTSHCWFIISLSWSMVRMSITERSVFCSTDR